MNISNFRLALSSPNGDVPQEVILSFKPFQGIYKELYHYTNRKIIITDNEQELRIKLNLHITHDFLWKYYRLENM